MGNAGLILYTINRSSILRQGAADAALAAKARFETVLGRSQAFGHLASSATDPYFPNKPREIQKG